MTYNPNIFTTPAITYGNGALIANGNQSNGNNSNEFLIIANNLCIVWGGFIIQSSLNTGVANMSIPQTIFSTRSIDTNKATALLGNSNGTILGYWYSAGSGNVFSTASKSGLIFCDPADNKYVYFTLGGAAGANGYTKFNCNAGPFVVNNWVSYQYIVPLA